MSGETVVVVASGLRDIGGHNYTYTRAVEGELRNRGFRVEVLANRGLSKSLQSEAGYRPVFSKGTYDFPSGRTPLHSLAGLWEQGRTYASELRTALREFSAPVVFCHTLSDFEFVGWSRWSRTGFAPLLVLLVRETPGFASMGWYRRWLHPYTGLRARTLRTINRRMRGGFVLATDTDQLSQDYSVVFRGRTRTFPIPVTPLGQVRRSAGHSEQLVFGYVGDCRAAKGFPRLAPMIKQVIALDNPERIRFVVQLYKGSYDGAQDPPGWGQLEMLADQAPRRVRLVRGVQQARDFQRLFESLDAVLIPNDHPAFRSGSSNVFCESAASGTPVVVADDTWMATQFARYGGGATFSLEDPSAFATSVLSMAQRWSEVSAKAEAFADRWRSEHNPGALVDALLSSRVGL